MASPAYRSSTTAGAATAANITINKPAGVVDNDILIAVISKDATDAITAPAGWTLVQQDTQDTWMLAIYWKRAASEGASWTWTFASTWRDCGVSAWSGGVTVDTPLDPDTPAAIVRSASALAVTCTANTTKTTNTTEIATYTNFSSMDGAAPTGMTSRNSLGEFRLCDLAFAGPGTTGTKTNGNCTQTQKMKGSLFEIASVELDRPEIMGRPFGLHGAQQMQQLITR